jgi:DNA polymerase-4
MATAGRPVLHDDTDAFFASAGQPDRPEPRGRPFLDGRAVVCAAPSESRPFRVHRALPAHTARRPCRQPVSPPTLRRYPVQVTRQLPETSPPFTPLVKPRVPGQAFPDVSGSEGLCGPAPAFARPGRPADPRAGRRGSHPWPGRSPVGPTREPGGRHSATSASARLVRV